MRQFSLVTFFFAAVVCWAGSGSAMPSRLGAPSKPVSPNENTVIQPVPVPVGLTQHGVAQLMGMPLSTDVHETSRLIIWYYKNGAVYFHDGKTIYMEPQKVAANAAGHIAVNKRPEPGKKGNLSQKDVDAIISAIPNDKPNDKGPMYPSAPVNEMNTEASSN